MLENCEFCKKEFNKNYQSQRFCTISCKNKAIKRTKKTYLCEECSNPCIARRKYCSECFINRTKKKKMVEIRNDITINGKHPSWTHVKVRLLCRSWNKELISMPCKICGYSLHVELCHIKPISAFGDDATLEEVNSKNNIVPLCRNHHWELDNGYISISGSCIKNDTPNLSNICECGKVIAKNSKKCRKCNNATKLGERNMINWPSTEEILDNLSRKSYLEYSKELGVSDNAIRKHLKARNISVPRKHLN